MLWHLPLIITLKIIDMKKIIISLCFLITAMSSYVFANIECFWGIGGGEWAILGE